MSATEQREQEYVVGTLQSVVVKGADKWQAVVLPDGSQYTKNLWTKDQTLVATLMSQIGMHMTFLCNVSHWTNQQNQPIRSLWVENVAVGGAVAAPVQPQPVVPQQQGFPPSMGQIVQPNAAAAPNAAMLPQQPQPGQVVVAQPQVIPMQAPGSDRELLRQGMIHRQTASKVAAIMLGYLEPGERNLSNLLVISERLVAYYDNGLPKTLEQELAERGLLQQDANAQAQAGMAASEGEPPSYDSDSDIPF